ncbi:acyltransferase family protein [Leifsonia sp. NPDC058292]|uniref:acyltransferase family protein n=1 Tax=Leifsonia sp. NPDC058292 TaxID=3346428 RepID=UPI0036D7FFD7
MTSSLTSPAPPPAPPELSLHPEISLSRPAVGAKRFAGLDGLRAVAVAAVLVYHLFPGILPGGFIGVDVFFVISGFLITSLLMRERARTGRIGLKRFWVRRARRLMPAIAVLVVVCSTAALAIGGDVLVGLGRQVLGAATFSANWLSIAANSSYFAQDAPELFRHLWSLAVEEQFYLVWPMAILALALVRSWWVRLAIVGSIALASAAAMFVLYTPGGDPTRVYFGSDTHSFGLAIGAAVAILVSRMRPIDLDAGETAMQAFTRRGLPALGLASFAGVLWAAWAMHDDAAFTYRGGLVIVSALTGIVIWAAVSPGSWLGRALDARPLRYVGTRSYGLYLWHWSVFVLVCAIIPDENDPSVAALVGLGSLAIATAATLLSYRYVELPIRRHGVRGVVRLGARRMRASAGARTAGIATITVATLLTVGTAAAIVLAPTGTGAQGFIENGKASLQNQPQSQHPATHRPPTGDWETLRVPPDPHPVATGPDISAFGDSVMLASAPALQERFPGISIDAVVSRQMSKAPDLVQHAKAAGSLRKVVLVGLGTNGSISADSLERLRQTIGDDRRLVLVSVQAPRSWTPGVNETLRAFAGEHPKQVVIAEWQQSIAPHLDLLADDQIHPGMKGGRIYSDALHSALLRLAERSPVRVANPWDKAGPRPQ